MEKTFSILSLNISTEKGTKKEPVDTLELRVNHGIVGDAHAGDWHRQVSLLADEDVDSMRASGVDLSFGDFAENITTRDISLHTLPVGTRLFLGDAQVEVTQIGKECHNACAIKAQVGDCIMPRRGIFVKVIEGGTVSRESRCYYRI